MDGEVVVLDFVVAKSKEKVKSARSVDLLNRGDSNGSCRSFGDRENACLEHISDNMLSNTRSRLVRNLLARLRFEDLPRFFFLNYYSFNEISIDIDGVAG